MIFYLDEVVDIAEEDKDLSSSVHSSGKEVVGGETTKCSIEYQTIDGRPVPRHLIVQEKKQGIFRKAGFVFTNYEIKKT